MCRDSDSLLVERMAARVRMVVIQINPYWINPPFTTQPDDNHPLCLTRSIPSPPHRPTRLISVPLPQLPSANLSTHQPNVAQVDVSAACAC